MAEIVAVDLDVTFTVFTVNTPDVRPAAIVTVAGTVAEERLLDSVTTKPPVGTTPVNFRVAVDEAPPFTDAGARVMERMLTGFTVRVAFSVAPPAVTVIDAVETVFTGDDLTAKFAEVLPAGIVTDAGRVTPVRPEASLTTYPPAPAMELMVTVPVEATPPTTEVGFSTID